MMILRFLHLFWLSEPSWVLRSCWFLVWTHNSIILPVHIPSSIVHVCSVSSFRSWVGSSQCCHPFVSLSWRPLMVWKYSVLYPWVPVIIWLTRLSSLCLLISSFLSGTNGHLGYTLPYISNRLCFQTLSGARSYDSSRESVTSLSVAN